jgi:hypothetical protein
LIAVKKKPKPEHKRRKMAHATEEMKQWSAMLQQEIDKWPRVSAKPMFGMRCYYRGKNVFGALPVTRSIDNANSFMFKIHPMPPALLKKAGGDDRVSASAALKAMKWTLFEMGSERDLTDALWWLNQAYEKAK